MFGSKRKLKEGAYVFALPAGRPRGSFVIGVVTGIDGGRVGVSGVRITPAGLANKVEQGKAGSRSAEILDSPTPENCIFALIYRIETEQFADVLESGDGITVISPRDYAILDGWVREMLPELINAVLSLPDSEERERAKARLRQKKDTLLDKNLKRSLYSVCRSLKIV